MTDDYTMTWVSCGKDGDNMFPSTSLNVSEDMKEAYIIKGREYDIRNIAESENTVMVELIESYPDSVSGKVYRTPLVLVLEMEAGKIRTGGHYVDPRLSYKFLSKEEVDSVYRNSKGSLEIIK